MIIAGSDIETTGLEPGDHRIIEVYIGLYDSDSQKKLGEYFKRIDPRRSIQPQAQAIHKISIEDLVGCPVWEDVAGDVRKVLERADLVVGHNWDGFDKRFIDYELQRVKLPATTKPTFDTMLEGRWATPAGTVPNLGALCWACGISYDASKAHRADYDVDVMMQAFFQARAWGWFKPEIQTAKAAA